MKYIRLREQLTNYYLTEADNLADDFYKKCTSILDEKYTEGLSPMQMKVLQYQTIVENFEPRLFTECPFYFETGTMVAECDGAILWRRGHKHAGGWTYFKNEHVFEDQDKELWETRKKHFEEILYRMSGPYNDVYQHFVYDYRVVLKGGLKGIYERAKSRLKSASKEESEFLSAICEAMLLIKKASEKFSEKAKAIADSLPNGEQKDNMNRIYLSAKNCPWHAPQSFYEALNTLAFMRKMVGSLEGIGTGTFGRLDLDLFPFYKKDIETGVINKETAEELITKFLLLWDTCYDHDMKMVYYADHEMENTYTLGGVDEYDNPVYNDLTEMFIRVSGEQKIIFPKIKCRFTKDSPREYFDVINKYVASGTSTILYQNDDAVIPALLRAGFKKEEARDYIVAGCWDINVRGFESVDGGAYVNMLKPFEYSVHNLKDKVEKVGLNIKYLDEAKTFEGVYQITLHNIKSLFNERARVIRLGGNVWHKVAPLPIFSSSIEGCIESAKDYTECGAKYNDDHYLCIGFPNIIDSLLAIKELCFDSKKYTLKEYLNAVRNDWIGHELMREEAKHCHGWGDGSKESSELGKRFNDDLFDVAETLIAARGGKVRLGHLTYTEIRWWGLATLATPDGRKSGEYFSQGLTPSRLKKIRSVTDVVNSFRCLDNSKMTGNSVLNVILPSNKITLDRLYAFMKAVASSAIQSLQLNCTTKEQLLDAQIHPEKYPDLIVRVTGFSARFTALSPEWQEEVLTRNFYE